MRGNLLTVKGLSFQMLSFYSQSFCFGLQMKSFVLQRKYYFEDKRIRIQKLGYKNHAKKNMKKVVKKEIKNDVKNYVKKDVKNVVKNWDNF